MVINDTDNINSTTDTMYVVCIILAMGNTVISDTNPRVAMTPITYTNGIDNSISAYSTIYLTYIDAIIDIDDITSIVNIDSIDDTIVTM